VALPTPTVRARQTTDPTAVVVFASTPFGAAFSELGSDFMLSAPDATGVSYRFDNSALLRTMIQTGGADADVFVSIDPSQMDSLNQANLLATAPAVLARDRLVIVVSQANPQGLREFKDLANPGVRFIIPSPSSTTSATIQGAFSKASADPAYGPDFGAQADRNVLSRDGDDRLVLDRISAGEVSAGIVFASSIDPGSRAKVQEVPIPDSISAATSYPIAVLKNGTNHQGGQAFMQYALSPQAQDLLSRYGFSRAAAANAGP
jgi:molybdate transport system substrate-binding protein